MWLHIPSECSAYAADTAVSTSPSGSHFLELERFATSSGKFRQLAYWHRAWRRGLLTPLRFGMTSPPSTPPPGLAAWILSWRDSPASPTQSRGNGKGTADRRWPVWDDIIRIAHGCATRAIFLENVPGLLTSSGGASIAKVRADLDHAGFTNQSACVIAASDVGASHRRNRLFILAHANSNTIREQSGWLRGQGRQDSAFPGADGQGLAHAKCTGLEGWQAECRIHQRQAIERGGYGIFAPGPDADWSAIDPRFWPATAQPGLRRVADGTSRGMDLSRADRLRALGNGVVPMQAAVALKHLAQKE